MSGGELRVSDCVADRIRLAVPQPTEWQRIGDQIDTASILARTNFIKMQLLLTAPGVCPVPCCVAETSGL